MRGAVFPDGQLMQTLQGTEEVRVTKEAWLGIVAQMDHMLGGTREVQARLAWDGGAPLKGDLRYHEWEVSLFSRLQYLG